MSLKRVTHKPCRQRLGKCVAQTEIRQGRRWQTVGEDGGDRQIDKRLKGRPSSTRPYANTKDVKVFGELQLQFCVMQSSELLPFMAMKQSSSTCRAVKAAPSSATPCKRRGVNRWPCSQSPALCAWTAITSSCCSCADEQSLHHAGLSFKKSPQAEALGDVEEGRGLQAAGPGLVTGGPVSLSSSLPFTPINLIFRVSHPPVKKEKTTPFGDNLVRSQVLYRAAQESSSHRPVPWSVLRAGLCDCA